ncbi:NAD(P)/FAD-dependent oxidoreductase [Luteolibacter flavescens]|uniref:NAD(P)/FAD-dependent oxidoreductase n=1 Tax=Luteolibacter flavescens TaxID=1859460 RepID=A0ABT3FVW6_9BACT|nr:NAD(P)/FAD-dependent oxidoreductase [Luteolibacter flavescens]MCW1887125.1 NAD(P)/FAD-dependent oxidoreductase [Luteolibacter flavescens]
MNGKIEVAIVGGGPAGCTLAALLAQRGIRTLVFDDDKRPELLVGESLLPRVVKLMRRLGIEDRVKEFSQFKPGVGFISRDSSRLDFFFPQKAIKGMPNYAYNIPRPEYDNLLRTRAQELGVTFVKGRAALEQGTDGREIQLTAECLASVPELGGVHPKLLVDSTGRARAFAKVIGIGAKRGKRNDVAYFAHFENFDVEAMQEGQVVITTLEHGWSWRIPLPGRLSVGVVVDKSCLKGHGDNPEERLESIIDAEPLLAKAGQGRRRVTPVMTYTNYQLISDRGHGPGWVATGDAFGFVDPMLSPGLFMAMHSADLIDQHAFSQGAGILDQPAKLSRAFDKVFEEMLDWHEAWAELIEYFYDGRMYALHSAGAQLSEKYGEAALPRLMERHLTKQITRLLSGVATRSRYGRGLLRFSLKHLVWDVAPAETYAIRG